MTEITRAAISREKDKIKIHVKGLTIEIASSNPLPIEHEEEGPKMLFWENKKCLEIDSGEVKVAEASLHNTADIDKLEYDAIIRSLNKGEASQ